MALIFPTSPLKGDAYQSGSSPLYQFNGNYWVVVTPATQVYLTAPSSSFAVTASFAKTANTLLGTVASASYALSASFVPGSTGTTPAYLSVRKDDVLSIAPSVFNIINGYTYGTTFANTVTSSWNAANGIFTVPVAGNYEVFSQFGLSTAASDALGRVFSLAIFQNTTKITQGDYRVENISSMLRPTVTVSAIFACTVGQQITIQAYHDFSGNYLGLSPLINITTIKQLPTKII